MLDVALIPRQILSRKQEHIVVVLDIFRASSTVCAALVSGASRIIPQKTVEDANMKKNDFPAALLCGERNGIAPEGFDFGNSPYEYTPETVGGRTLIFTTTNGASALLSAPDNAVRLMGGFVNAESITEFIAQRRPAAATFLCAGNNGFFSLEDALCAGMFVERISSLFPEQTDEALAAKAIFTVYKNNLHDTLKNTCHAQNLNSKGLGKDLDFCTNLNAAPVTPIFNGCEIVCLSEDNL
ncbi:2-phosphosulfolactate phosphatase family protein [Ignavibacteria bacterium]|nr:2-phosphosulfolactate phosphatase [Bacteroidota bacterium]MCZ2133304.1 2-phosphosulfolactate phosphatase [Bacteroidota bacterium]